MALVSSKAVIQALKNRVAILAADKKRLEEKVDELRRINENLKGQLEVKPKRASEQPKPPAEPSKTIVLEEERTEPSEKPKRTRRASV